MHYILTSFKNSRAKDMYGLNYLFLKSNKQYRCTPVTHIVNPAKRKIHLSNCLDISCCDTHFQMWTGNRCGQLQAHQHSDNNIQGCRKTGNRANCNFINTETTLLAQMYVNDTVIIVHAKTRKPVAHTVNCHQLWPVL